MKKQFTIIIILVFILSLIIITLYSSGKQNYRVSAGTSKSTELLSDKKIYCNATLKDDFNEETILAVVDNRFTDKVLSAKDFKSDNIKSIKYLTRDPYDGSLVGGKPAKLNFRDSSIKEMKNSIKNTLNQRKSIARLTNISAFRHIVKITLKEKSKQNVLSVIKQIEQLDFVRSAEPSFILESSSTPISSADYIDEQYALERIDAFSVWNITTGNPTVKVGIIDSGIGYHQDLDANKNDLIDFMFHLYENEYSLNDILVFIQDSLGGDLDIVGHGTGIAGIIGGKGIGISGVSPDITLVSLMAGWPVGYLEDDTVIPAIEFARINNIPIINCSFVSTDYSFAQFTALQNYAGLAVCAAGNEDNDNDNLPFYPASYDLDNIISVGATRAEDDARATSAEWGFSASELIGSNYGAASVDIFAPGTCILSTVSRQNIASKYFGHLYYPHADDQYHFGSGTSFAVPFVTGVAALILSEYPEINAIMVKQAIMAGADYVPQLDGLCVTGGRLRIVIMPNNMTSIGYGAFAGCSSLERITMPKNATSIGEFAFAGCQSLESIRIPNGVSIVDVATFYVCTSLKSVNLPNSLTSIGYGAFVHCWSLLNFVIPGNVTSIGEQAFIRCNSLVSLNIPDGVISLENDLFIDCWSLKNIIIPDSVITIGYRVFNLCVSLTNIVLPNNLLSIGHSAFSYSALENVIIPNSVTLIDSNAFQGCNSLVNVVLSNNITSIEYAMFYECSSLQSISIPNTVTSIGEYAFSSCSSLASIVITNSVTSIESNSFYNCSQLTIYIETGANQSGWSAYWNGSNCPVVLDCTLSTYKTYVMTFTKTSTSLTNPNSYNISSPYSFGYDFGGWNTAADGSGIFYLLNNQLQYDAIPNGTVLHAIWI